MNLPIGPGPIRLEAGGWREAKAANEVITDFGSEKPAIVAISDATPALGNFAGPNIVHSPEAEERMDTQDLVKDAGMRREAHQAQGWQPLVVAVCSLAIIAALVLGVGIGSHLVLRHVVQTLPLWVAVTLGLKRSLAAGWAGLPVFLFWLVLMTVIWLYLLGVSNILSGHFTQLEIAMTVVVGIAAGVGIVAFFRLKSYLSGWALASIFIVLAVVQLVCFRLSFLPALAHR